MTDDAIIEALAALLDRRSGTATICPSDVARRLAPDDAQTWRALMPQVRAVAAQLAARGLLQATQKGVVVDAVKAKGPIRLGRPATPAED